MRSQFIIVIIWLSASACFQATDKESIKSLPKLKTIEVKGLTHAWVITYNKRYLRTQDGGKSWENKSLEEVGNPSRISFINLTTGWAVDKDGNILKTIDGGNSWIKVSFIPYKDKQSAILIISIQFIDNLHGWVIDPYFLWYTEDGGLSWDKRCPSNEVLNHKAQIYCGFLVSSRVWWLCGDQGKIYSTMDGGRTWLTKIVDSDAVVFDDIQFASDKLGWVMSYTGSAIYRTWDGGISWKKIKMAFGDERLLIKSVQFINLEDGWAAGKILSDNVQFNGLPIGQFGAAIVLHTKDGGQSWEPVKAGEKEPFFERIFFADLQNGWLVGQGNVYHTENGGQYWQKALALK